MSQRVHGEFTVSKFNYAEFLFPNLRDSWDTGQPLKSPKYVLQNLGTLLRKKKNSCRQIGLKNDDDCWVAISSQLHGDDTRNVIRVITHVFFPNAKQEFPFHFGAWGLRLCRRCAIARNRLQVSVWSPYGRTNGEFCKSCHFWRFHTFCFKHYSLVSRGRRGTFVTFQHVAGGIFLLRFQKMNCSFRGRRSILETSIVISHGRRSTSNVSCCVFSSNRNVRAAPSSGNVQIPSQAWDFVACEIANFEVHKKARRKTSIFWLQSENRRKSRTKSSFWGSNMSPLIWFSCGVAVSMGEAAKPLLVEGFQTG